VNVAMRSSGGTNFGLASSVVARTKSRIACLALPSFDDAKGIGICCLRRTFVDTNGLMSAGNSAKLENQNATVDAERQIIGLQG
jgi:hypothetical protein